MTTAEAADGPFPLVELCDGVVTLRCLEPSDSAAMLDGEDDGQVRWLNEGHRSEPVRQAVWIAKNQREWQTGGPRRHFGIRDQASGELAGTVEAHLALPGLAPGTVNLSYAVFPAWRGRGFAARAIDLVCEWLTIATDADTVVLRIDAANTPSLRVAREAGCVPGGTGRDGLLHHVRPLR
ncbi:GNAT family N-acetyltransferase [Cellulomonas sp. P5_C5]